MRVSRIFSTINSHQNIALVWSDQQFIALCSKCIFKSYNKHACKCLIKKIKPCLIKKQLHGKFLYLFWSVSAIRINLRTNMLTYKIIDISTYVDIKNHIAHYKLSCWHIYHVSIRWDRFLQRYKNYLKGEIHGNFNVIILKITISKLTDVFKMRVHFKGNAQFLFLCNPPKSDVSQVACITFFQVTQKILTKDIFHWLKVIIEILSFPQIISMRKTTTQFF